MSAALTIRTTALAVLCAVTIGDAAAAPQTGGIEPARRLFGSTHLVSTSVELQNALTSAEPGDTIVLRSGVYTGPFRLPRKNGARWIEIRGPGGAGFPARGTRIRSNAFASLPKLVSKSRSVLVADPGAHHYRLIGLEISPAPGTFLFNVIDLGSEVNRVEDLPQHIVIERSYIHGDTARGSRRGVALNGAHITIVDSHLSDFKEEGADSQAICGWNGPGPFRIENNYIEAAGENIMFGGADPEIPNLVPSDILVLRNYFSKPLAWREGHPEYAGTPWTVKNLFELKNARRVLIRDNFFEHNWTHAQNGMAILFTPRSEDGRVPWATVEDVTFENNIVRAVGGGISVLGRDDARPSQLTRRLIIRNNLFFDVGGEWGDGRLFIFVGGAAQVTIDHNTALQSGQIVVAEGDPHPAFTFQNNIAPHNEFGVIGSGEGPGRPALDRFFPGVTFRRNVLPGGDRNAYPPDNFFPARLADVGFVGLSGLDLRLAPSSQFRGRATDGADPGVNVGALRLAWTTRQ